MLKILATMSLAALLSLSPALAAKKTTPPEPTRPAAICLAPDGFIKTHPDNVTLVKDIIGDDIARLNKAQPNTLPEGTNRILVFAQEGYTDTYVMLVFKDQCLVGKGGISASFLKSALGPKGESI